MTILVAIPGGALSALFAAGILVGLVSLLFGYRLFRIALGVLGFVVGAVLGCGVGAEVGGGVRALVLGAVAGGPMGAFLFVVLWKVGVFATGAAFGPGLTTAVHVAATDVKAEPVLLVAAGSLFGVIALGFRKPLLVLTTSCAGAIAVVLGVGGFAGHYDPTPLAMAFKQSTQHVYENDTVVDFLATHPAYLWAALALALLGATVQLLVTGRKVEE